jgi:uncharacterized delta-60 repeat protein
MKCTKAAIRLHRLALAAASLLACAASPAAAAHAGDIDGSFGLGGFVTNDFFGTDEQVFAVAPMRDGRFVAAGKVTGQVAITRFIADGRLDTTFGGGDGIVVLDPFFGAASDVLTTIALHQAGDLGADDRIVIGGYTFGRNCALLARLTADGAVDATLGAGGRVVVSAANTGGVRTGMSYLASARLAADGKILALGEGGDRGMALMRFAGNGAFDTTFGNDGRSLIKFSGVSDEDIPAALALQGNGRIVAAGYATNRSTGAAHKDFFVGRWLPNGAVDTAFGDGHGSRVAQVAVGEDEAFAVAVEVSGNILAGGYSTRPNDAPRDYALLRLFGDPDRIFTNGFDGPAL